MTRESIVAIALLLSLNGLPSLADHVPQACYDGRDLMRDDTAAAIGKLTECLASSHLTNEVKAIAHYNRAASHYGIYLNEDDQKIADKHLFLAFEDIEIAIKLEPNDGDSYCLRGQIDLEMSFGFYGYEDIDKGKELGGRDEVCHDPF